MGGINSLSGLNNVNVDFRPTVEPNVPKATNANQPQPAPIIALDEEQQPPAKAEGKSVVRQLDVLLLNAAGNSVATDGVKRMDVMGKALVKLGVIDKKDADKLVNLAKDASDKLKALDKFSGREIAKALMTDKKSGELVWGKGFFGMNAAAKAVKAAVEAQEAFSEALGKFNDLLAGSKKVNAALQDAFTEMQFQCDRRATEIYSVAVRMHDLVQQDVVNGADADPQVAAYLDAKFNELMPREAIINTLGLQSVALPEEIDQDFYNHLIAMDDDPAKKKAFLDSIAPRISPDALRATEARLDEAIAHARTLDANKKVYGKEQWQNEENLAAMTGFKATVTIRKTDGSTVKVDNKIECVRDYNERKCPSFYKREFFHRMFDKPE